MQRGYFSQDVPSWGLFGSQNHNAGRDDTIVYSFERTGVIDKTVDLICQNTNIF